MTYMYAGYAVGMGTLVAYAVLVMWRRRHLERLVAASPSLEDEPR